MKFHRIVMIRNSSHLKGNHFTEKPWHTTLNNQGKQTRIACAQKCRKSIDFIFDYGFHSFNTHANYPSCTHVVHKGSFLIENVHDFRDMIESMIY